MCFGSKAPSPPPPPAPPPAQAPVKPSVVDFEAVDTDSGKMKKLAAGKKQFRVKPKQNSLGTNLSGTGLTIPKANKPSTP